MNEQGLNLINLWTPEEDAYLAQHYNSCKAMDIASHLGRTKNAVIGRAQRLKLGTPMPFIRAERIKKLRAIFAAHKDKPVAPRKSRVAVFRKDGVKLAPTPLIEDVTTPLNGVGVKIWDLEADHCRWVMGDPADLTYCGHPKMADSCYCPTHYRKSVNKNGPNRVQR
jgi:hypothetical protein